jgi:phosphoadenosine phosphosulfate reductase
MEKLRTYQNELENKEAVDIISWALEKFSAERIALATSFSIEDQALTHLIISQNPKARVFTLDTGRIFQETYNVMQETMKRYGMTYEVYAPDAGEIDKLVSESGPNLFYESLEKRKRCCEIRKLHPLKKVLATVDAWICGMRREQSVTRADIHKIEWDSLFNIYKINPLFNWNEEEVWKYIRKNNIPYNKLYESGFKSIGCAPCTRAVGKNEDVRSGRWWWESPEHKECGLHKRPQSAE